MKKIMFNDRYGLTEAVLSGRKTMTRRIVPQKDLDKACEFIIAYFNATFDVLDDKEALQHYFFVEKIGKPPYKVGEVVAIAQAYRDFGAYCIDSRAMTDKRYVKAEYMPHQIRFTNVRVERLQDISHEDCIKEGVQEVCVNNNWGNSASHWEFQVPYEDKLGRMKLLRGATPREAYAALIDKIYGYGTWESDPYVFVYEFELME